MKGRRPVMPCLNVKTDSSTISKVPPSIIDPFIELINPVDKQFELLCEYNELHWNNALTKKHLYFVEKSIRRQSANHKNHIQRLDDMKILYVDFGSPEQTFKSWMKIVIANKPEARRGIVLTDEKNLRLCETGVYEYNAISIYQLRMNMVAFWNPYYDRSASEIRKQAKTHGILIGHGESIASLCLNPELFNAMDGRNLPNIYLAGYEMNVYNGSGEWDWGPCFCQRPGNQLPSLRIIPSDFRMPNCAAPVLLL